MTRRTINIWSADRISNVPCEGCHACCVHDRVYLHPEWGDRPADHQGYTLIDERGRWFLKWKPDSEECIYLVREGCSLYGQDRRPRVCLELDCRHVAEAMGWKAVPGLIGQEVIDAAKRLKERCV